MPRVAKPYEGKMRKQLRRLGLHIRSLRFVRGLSQKQLAELAGLSPSSISRYEAGELDPTYTVLQNIAFGLGFDSVEDMLKANPMEMA
jgi:transcriptional regulator with XRE-family HTH domain